MTHAQPTIVERQAWQTARDALLDDEKQLTHRADAVAAARRRLPMTPVGEYVFEGPDGPVSLVDLFAGRRQLVVQHFMFDPSWDAGCPSCSNLADNMTHPEHLAPYDLSFARISRAPADRLAAYSARMGWTAPWVSSGDTTFNDDWGWTEDGGEVPGVSWYLRDGDAVFLTNTTTGRGVEQLSSLTGYLDGSVLGRQETWENSPDGWPRTTRTSGTGDTTSTDGWRSPARRGVMSA